MTGTRGRDTAPEAPREPFSAKHQVLVEDHDGLLLLRTPADDTFHPADIADLARDPHTEDGTVTVVVGAVEAGALWQRLSESLGSLRKAGTRFVRLVMAGAGYDHPDRPALARWIADKWDLVVEAPDGPVLLVPGGSVFVPPGNGGWWRFARGLEPTPLGPRSPAPDWQSATRWVPPRTTGGYVLDQIPAGVLIRRAEAARPRPGDLFHAIPVDHERLTVVVGVPGGEDVAASDVAEFLTSLPAAVRPGVRLVPGGQRDLLPLGQSVAWMLNAEVEVSTGLPLFAADGPLGTYGVRSVLVDADGAPTWVPFVDAAMCLPSVSLENPQAPRLLRRFLPLPGTDGAEEGVAPLFSEQWQATATRAGLWVAPRDGSAPPDSGLPVSSDGPVIEISWNSDRFDPSLWPVLSLLLTSLAPDLRTRATLSARATPPDGGQALRGLAADHGLRAIHFSQAGEPFQPQGNGGAPAPDSQPSPETDPPAYRADPAQPPAAPGHPGTAGG